MKWSLQTANLMARLARVKFKFVCQTRIDYGACANVCYFYQVA